MIFLNVRPPPYLIFHKKNHLGVTPDGITEKVGLSVSIWELIWINKIGAVKNS